MGKYQLIIDNQIADVYTDTDVMTAISYMISDISDLEKSRNPTTKTMKLPGTNRNKRIFGFADDINVPDFTGQKKSVKGEIREDGTSILSGVVNLKSVTRIGSSVTFDITIIGNSGEWVSQMKDASLMGVDLGGDHTKDATYINGYSTSLPAIYGLINNGFPGGQVKIESIEDDGNGMAKCYLDGTNSILNLRDNFYLGETLKGYTFSVSAYNKNHIIDAMSADNSGKEFFVLRTPYMGDATGIFRQLKANICVEDRPMLLNIRIVLQKMFALWGYEISSSFIETDFFKRLYLLPGKERQPASFVSDCYAKATIISNWATVAGNIISVEPFPFDAVTGNVSGLFNTINHRFTASVAMHGIFTASLNIKGTEGYEAYVLFRVFNSSGTLQTGGHNRNRVTVTLEEANYTLLTQEAEIRLQAGDYFTIDLLVPQMGGSPASSIYVSKDETCLNCEISDRIIKGSSIVPGNFLPDIKQLDFLKAIRHLFNLYFLTDINMKRVYIEPRDTFYKSDKYIDLTEKLDISKEIIYEEIGSELTKSLAFKYKEDGDDYGVKEWEKLNGRYSTYLASLLNVFSPDGETKIENPLFAPTVMASFPASGLTNLLPKIWKTPETGDTFPEFMDEYVPRILYYAGQVNCNSGETWKFEGAPKSDLPVFYSNDPLTSNSNSLLFDPLSIDLELFSKHYANYIRTLNEGRKITAYFKLNALDIQALMTPDITGSIVKDFRSKVLFRHKGETTHCRIDSVVDYMPGQNRTTKVVLITDVDNTFNNAIIPYRTLTFTNNSNTLPDEYSNAIIWGASSDWEDIHDAVSGGFITQSILLHGIGVLGGVTPNVPYTIERVFLYFDTHEIPDTATIHSVYLDIYKLSGEPSMEVTVFEGTQGNTLALSDFSEFGATAFGESSPGNLGFRRIYFNAAGIAAINRTGWTKLCLRESHYDTKNTPSDAILKTFRTNLVNAPANYCNKLTVKYLL